MSSRVKLSQQSFFSFCLPFLFPPTLSGVPCTNHTFQCRNNICIRKQNAKCDGTVDCIDGSDESSCSKSLSNVHLFELSTFYAVKPFITSCFEVGRRHSVGTEKWAMQPPLYCMLLVIGGNDHLSVYFKSG